MKHLFLKNPLSLMVFLLFATLMTTIVNADPVSEGKGAFTQYTCNTCHSLTSKKEPSHTGPALFGVTKRHTKDWMISWISDPEEMLKKDATAKNKKSGRIFLNIFFII